MKGAPKTQTAATDGSAVAAVKDGAPACALAVTWVSVNLRGGNAEGILIDCDTPTKKQGHVRKRADVLPALSPQQQLDQC
jgi:hypothetical protein